MDSKEEKNANTNVLTIKAIRTMTGLSQRKFSNCYGIPYPSLVNWERGVRNPPEYLLLLLERVVREDMGVPVEKTREKYPIIPWGPYEDKKKSYDFNFSSDLNLQVAEKSKWNSK